MVRALENLLCESEDCLHVWPKAGKRSWVNCSMHKRVVLLVYSHSGIISLISGIIVGIISLICYTLRHVKITALIKRPGVAGAVLQTAS